MTPTPHLPYQTQPPPPLCPWVQERFHGVLGNTDDTLFFDAALTWIRPQLLRQAIDAGEHIYREKLISEKLDQAIRLRVQLPASRCHYSMKSYWVPSGSGYQRCQFGHKIQRVEHNVRSPIPITYHHQGISTRGISDIAIDIYSAFFTVIVRYKYSWQRKNRIYTTEHHNGLCHFLV